MIVPNKKQARMGVLLIVLICYGIFTLPCLTPSNFNKHSNQYYSKLTEAFLAGQLSLVTPTPAPELAKLSNPYDPWQNHKYRHFDLTYYHHKYYVYWGPLPVLAYYLPMKVLTGYDGPDGLGLFFFIAIGFLFNFFLLCKIKDEHFPTTPDWQANLLFLMMGLANNSTFLEHWPCHNEVAVGSAYAMMSIALYYLYKIFSKSLQKQDYYLFSTCLSLTVACRPHFILICILLMPIVSIFLIKKTPRQKLLGLLVALLLPACTIGTCLAVYNYERFDSIFEFGHAYQLGALDYSHLALVSPFFYRIIPLQMYYYLVQPFIWTINPYKAHLPSFLQPLNHDVGYLTICGIFSTAPIVLFILFFPKFWRSYFRDKQPAAQQLLWFQSATVAATAVMALFLCILYYNAQRYISDFLPYLIISAIINLWFLETYKFFEGLALLLLKIFVICSIVIGIVSGIELGHIDLHQPQFLLSVVTHFSLGVVAEFTLIWIGFEIIGIVIRETYAKNYFRNND